jgi:hypothetical protein
MTQESSETSGGQYTFGSQPVSSNKHKNKQKRQHGLLETGEPLADLLVSILPVFVLS